MVGSQGRAEHKPASFCLVNIKKVHVFPIRDELNSCHLLRGVKEVRATVSVNVVWQDNGGDTRPRGNQGVWLQTPPASPPRPPPPPAPHHTHTPRPSHDTEIRIKTIHYNAACINAISAGRSSGGWRLPLAAGEGTMETP